MTVKITSKLPLETCPDCDRVHLGRCGGLSFGDRLRSVRLGTEWMPAKQRDREIGSEKGGKDYFDDESLRGMFGDNLTGKERHEELLEETQGVGYVSPEELAEHPDLVAAHYLDNPSDEIPEV